MDLWLFNLVCSSPAFQKMSIPNGTPAPNPTAEIFSKSFEHWLQQQHQDLFSLRSAAVAAATAQAAVAEEEDGGLRPLISGVISHYERYYLRKSASAKRDVLPMFSPSWTSSTENLFLWVGGWRPSTAFHLLYSKSGIQLELQLETLIRGLRTHDLVDLSSQQLQQVDALQRETIRAEKEVSEEEARAQESVADARMVAVVGQMAGEGEETHDPMIGAAMEKKEEAMERALEKADGLRMETLKGVVGILRPIQAVHFLIAAAELHLMLHEFGERKDERTRISQDQE